MLQKKLNIYSFYLISTFFTDNVCLSTSKCRFVRLCKSVHVTIFRTRKRMINLTYYINYMLYDECRSLKNPSSSCQCYENRPKYMFTKVNSIIWMRSLQRVSINVQKTTSSHSN